MRGTPGSALDLRPALAHKSRVTKKGRAADGWRVPVSPMGAGSILPAARLLRGRALLCVSARPLSERARPAWCLPDAVSARTLRKWCYG